MNRKTTPEKAPSYFSNLINAVKKIVTIQFNTANYKHIKKMRSQLNLYHNHFNQVIGL
ncbi:MAG: hypothetical protein J0M08_01460 [Bacteroidetes bacterium]|nr:hypothetical protein [Bacteroidota bacterium]